MLDAIRLPFQSGVDILSLLDRLDGGEYLPHTQQTTFKDQYRWEKGEYELCLYIMLDECVVSRVHLEHKRQGTFTAIVNFLKTDLPHIGIRRIVIQSVTTPAMAAWCLKNGFKPVMSSVFDTGEFLAGDYSFDLGEPSPTIPYFTIQSKEFFDTLMSGGIWKADSTLARERGSVWERDGDRVALDGAEPVYVYKPNTYWRPRLKNPMRSELEAMRCQMSTDWDRLYGRYLCVLDLPRKLPVSTAHNASPYVQIVSEVKQDSLLAAYEIVLRDNFWEQGLVARYVVDSFKCSEVHKMLLEVD